MKNILLSKACLINALPCLAGVVFTLISLSGYADLPEGKKVGACKAVYKNTLTAKSFYMLDCHISDGEYRRYNKSLKGTSQYTPDVLWERGECDMAYEVAERRANQFCQNEGLRAQIIHSYDCSLTFWGTNESVKFICAP